MALKQYIANYSPLNALLIIIIALISSNPVNKFILNKINNKYVLELQNYTEYFVNRVSPYYNKNYLQNLQIYVSNRMSIDKLAHCISYEYSSVRIIEVNAKHWERLDSFSRKIIMLHELGHCLCDIGHEHLAGTFTSIYPDPQKTDEFLSDGCPTSLMFYSYNGHECYAAHYEFYIATLKKQCAQKMKFK